MLIKLLLGIFDGSLALRWTPAQPPVEILLCTGEAPNFEDCINHHY
ncbi:hypothetical protein ACFPZL_01790 [Leucobacter soli]|nr:hypothetical protein [Leucobacter soli]